MITSALISQARREYFDVPKKTKVTKDGDGSTNLFNVVNFPVIEGSEAISISGGAELTDPTHYSLDDDSGDLLFVTVPDSGDEIQSLHKYAHWRDKNWNEAINQGIGILNSRGFFKQVVRKGVVLSAGTKTFVAASAAVDGYELLHQPTSGKFTRMPTNWSYQQDANTFILGNPVSSSKLSAAYSYLRQLQTYAETSATLDVPSGAIEPLKKYAGAMFFRSVAAKNALQGNASIDEGHFSFTNLRTMSNDLMAEFDNFATRSKPTRPAKGIQYHIEGGGEA